MNCPSFEEIIQHLEEDLPVSRSKEIEDHMGFCAPCKKIVADVRGMTSRIAKEPGEFRSPEFVKRVVSSAASVLKTAPERHGRPFWIWPAIAVPLVAAAALMVVLPLSNRGATGEDSSFVARGGAEIDPSRWISLEVFHPQGTAGSYVPVQDAVQADEPLVFSVKNNRQSPYRFMMVLGIQSTGATYWYYPAYTEPGQNPKSVSVAASQETQNLGEEIRHKLSPGWLRIVGIFSERPLDVQTIERLVAQTMAERGGVEKIDTLPIENVGQLSKLIRVERRTER